MTQEGGIQTRREDLPQSLQELSEVTGVDGAVALSRTFGGRCIYVPEYAHPEHPLAQVVGLEAAVAMGKRWGGGERYIPEARCVDRAKRNDEIRAEHASGRMTVQAIADKWGISTRQVWRLCKQGDTDG